MSTPRSPRGVTLAVVAASLLLASCASAPPASPCLPDEQPGIMDSLYFGTSMPGGRVTADDWQRFLAEVITPRFPEGLTAWSAAGQWQNPAGELEKEDSYVLHVVHADASRYDVAVHEVIAEYKKRFLQQSVLRVRTRTCISF